jgi:hypothetical protein
VRALLFCVDRLPHFLTLAAGRLFDLPGVVEAAIIFPTIDVPMPFTNFCVGEKKNIFCLSGWTNATLLPATKQLVELLSDNFFAGL